MYQVFLFVHLAGVIAWVGGALSVAMLTTRLASRPDTSTLPAGLRDIRFIGATILGTGALLTMIGGFGLMAVLRLSPTLWIGYGLLGIVLSFGLGGTMVRRTSDRVLAAPDDRAAKQRLVAWNFAMVALLLSVVAAMVFKPTL